MDENEILTPEELVKEDKEHYTPRPKWQIVLAWIALVIFVAGVVLYYVNIITPY